MFPSQKHPENGIFIEQQVASLRKKGIDVEVLFVDVKPSRLNYIKSFRTFWKHIRRNNFSYDLIHAHYIFAGIVSRIQTKIPVVLTHHGDETFHGWQSYLCWITSRLVSKVIVVSQEMKTALGLENVSVIPCGVNCASFFPINKMDARRRLGLPIDKYLVLFAGDISKKLKRFDLVEEAVGILKSKEMNVELVIAYKKPYELIPYYMNACDVMILASEREGSPQVIKEALACNLSVISTDVGDVKEIFNNVNNCFISKREANDFAEKIAFVLQNNLKSNGREFIRMKYDTNVIADRLISIYNSVLDIAVQEPE